MSSERDWTVRLAERYFGNRCVRWLIDRHWTMWHVMGWIPTVVLFVVGLALCVGITAGIYHLEQGGCGGIGVEPGEETDPCSDDALALGPISRPLYTYSRAVTARVVDNGRKCGEDRAGPELVVSPEENLWRCVLGPPVRPALTVGAWTAPVLPLCSRRGKPSETESIRGECAGGARGDMRVEPDAGRIVTMRGYQEP